MMKQVLLTQMKKLTTRNWFRIHVTGTRERQRWQQGKPGVTGTLCKGALL